MKGAQATVGGGGATSGLGREEVVKEGIPHCKDCWIATEIRR